jgi:hypothetical protein
LRSRAAGLPHLIGGEFLPFAQSSQKNPFRGYFAECMNQLDLVESAGKFFPAVQGGQTAAQLFIHLAEVLQNDATALGLLLTSSKGAIQASAVQSI